MRDEEHSVWQTKPEREQKEETKQSRWGFRGMTVRNWLELLIVPLVLVGIGLLFEMQQANRQQEMEEQQQALEERRAEAERELAEQRAQDEALQAYLDQMSQLMLDRKLLEAEPGDPVYTLAQARTSTAILRLDAEHNESVLRFLSDSGLAGTPVRESSINLFREIDLSEANLSEANLPNTDLREADLSGANLSNAFLDNANLSGAILHDAHLSGAYLGKADLSAADLSKASLFEAALPDANLRYADLHKVNLGNAFLENTNLNGTNLSYANLSETNLRKANLSDSYLMEADLSNAYRWTDEQLAEAQSLEGATMPNGQKYEEWLKDREKRQQAE